MCALRVDAAFRHAAWQCGFELCCVEGLGSCDGGSGGIAEGIGEGVSPGGWPLTSGECVLGGTARGVVGTLSMRNEE